MFINSNKPPPPPCLCSDWRSVRMSSIKLVEAIMVIYASSCDAQDPRVNDSVEDDKNFITKPD